MRRCVFAFVLVASATVGVAAGQDAPQDNPPKQPGKGDTVVVRGCVRGTALESYETRVADTLGKVESAITFRMTGNKDLLKPLRSDHNGHMEEVTGVLKSTLPTEHVTRGKQVGRTRIVIGMAPPSRSGPAGMNTPNEAVPVLEVKSARHVSNQCGV